MAIFVLSVKEIRFNLSSDYLSEPSRQVLIKKAFNAYVIKKFWITWERSGSVVECLTRDQGVVGFEPHRRHCVVSLSKILVQPRKTRPVDITEKKVDLDINNQTNKQNSG